MLASLHNTTSKLNMEIATCQYTDTMSLVPETIEQSWPQELIWKLLLDRVYSDLLTIAH